MNPRKLVLLNPYQYPTQSPLTLADEDMACWLNGYSALWHPATLWRADGPPTVAAGYDHEEPKPDHVYALPESPPMYLPDDWEQRVRAAGSVTFRAAVGREQTFANLREALASATVPADDAEAAALSGLRESPSEKVAPFLGVGLGYLVSTALSDAMEHENLFDRKRFWDEIQLAAAALAGLPDAAAEPGQPDAPEPWLGHLQAAAGRMLAAREVLYPVTIYLLDLCLLEETPSAQPLPASFDLEQPLNLIASSSHLERLKQEQPELLDRLRAKVASEQAEVCGGCYAEREDALLPLESQLWNLLKGRQIARELLGADVRTFARRRFGAHPQLPLLLTSAGLFRGVLVPFDDSALPTYNAAVVSWTAPDARQVDAFVRKPLPADSADTFFNLGHHLYKTVREDHYATLALVHRDRPAAPWYRDWLELSRLAPVLGQWHTFTKYFEQIQPGEYISTLSADDFHFDYLSERVPTARKEEGGRMRDEPDATVPVHPSSFRLPPSEWPVSGFARHARLRRRLDTCWTLAAIRHALAGRSDPLHIAEELRSIEDQIEARAPEAAEVGTRLAEIEKRITGALAERLLARATANQPGYLILNPCSFARRVALELDGATAPLPILDAVKACQLDGERLRAVVEVPALGFAWIPRSGPKGTLPPAMRMRLADEHGVRNEFFEAEIDPATGGLRGIRDHRTGVNRLAQRLVFNPGSTMRAGSVKVTSAGPALGEIVAEGALLGERDQILAKFRQRFRAWLGRPVLELRIELFPEQPAAGYPWHAYYGSRFAWREERGVLLRGVNGASHITTHVRPQTPDFLELRLARQSTVIFPGGLPFHQRQEGRMVDVILAPGGETAQVFELGIALDREHPMQTALGMITPVPLVPTEKGPPHVGAKGWLFHLDAPNLLLTSMRPGGVAQPSEDGAITGDGLDAITVRMLECAAHHSHAEFRCVRDPRRVTLLDARGEVLMEAMASGDAAVFDVSPGDLIQLQVEFS